MRKIGIVGMGHVGATVALMIAQNGYADEMVLIDKTKEKAVSEAGDIIDAQSLLNYHVKTYVGDYSDLADADIVLSTLGHVDQIAPGGDRFQELRANIPEIQQFTRDLKASGFGGIVIATTNPNDVVVDMYRQQTGLPAGHIMGTGTYLDTARLKRQVAEALNVDARSISGYALGEHGESQFAAWSTVRVASRPFTEIAKTRGLKLDEIEDAARWGGFTVHRGKGYTNVAIAAATIGLMNLVFSDAKNIAICSHYDAANDSYISTPALIGADGVEEVVALDLTADEQQKLQDSADKIKENVKKFS